jgi:tRNA A-37 threonylcarbamoyl transferase component Bud32
MLVAPGILSCTSYLPRTIPDRRVRDAVSMTDPVRVGDTFRRAAGPNTQLVHRVLRHLEAAGVPWAPRALGIDDECREVLSWIPGLTATAAEEVNLDELARMVRRLHDLTVGFVVGRECIIHDDLQPRNVVVRHGHPVGIIDWEQARPGRRVEDVANLCWSFVEPAPESRCEDIGLRWRRVAGAYGLEARDDLVPTIVARMSKCAEDIEREASRGSVRHRRLADRGDHVRIRAMQEWVSEHERALRSVVGA